MRNTQNWTIEEIIFLKENFEKLSKKEIAEKLHRTPNGIQIKANRLGLKHPDKYSYNKSFFHVIDTEQKAYWLGFFYADGYTQKRVRNNEASIMLSVVDADHLRKFNKAIEGNVEVTTQIRGNGFNDKKSEVATIRLYSSEIVDDLISHGCVPNKTKSIKFPKLETESLQWAFIRGFFDGDGCLCFNKKKQAPQCHFTSASLMFIEDLRDYLYERKIYSYIIEEGKECYRLALGGLENTHLFLNSIYKNASIYLDRKYERHCYYIKEYNIKERILNNKNPRKI